jgi:hypothetical protein
MQNKSLLMKEIRDSRGVIAGRLGFEPGTDFYNDYLCLHVALKILGSVGEQLNNVSPEDIPVLAASALESLAADQAKTVSER